MKRKFFFQVVAAPLALLGCGQQAPAQIAPVPPTQATRPNVVVMIADDLTYHDLGCWGNKDVKTPNLDRLAAQGMRLTGCYSPAPVCSPMRQALYTGLFPVKSGAYPNHAIVKPEVKSLPHYLQPLGYRVGLVGKKHFGPAQNFPFEYPERAANAVQENDDEGNDSETALNYEAAEKFVDRNKNQPYCLVVAAHEPHSPWNKGDASVYQPAQLTLPPYLVDTPTTRRALARYYGEVTYLDQQVGRVMDAVERSGQADNTLLLFLSEQGSSMPHGKWTLYDAGIRSATIARWPAKIKAGTTNDALCQYVDFLPTFIEMAGGQAVAGLDGRSVLDVLTGKSAQGRDFVFAEETSRGIIAGPEAYGIRAVADKRWKYILNLNADATFKNTEVNGQVFQSWVRKGETDTFAREQVMRYQHRPAIELYDLQNDPYELTNLAAQPEQKSNLARLRAALDAWMQQQGDEGVKTEMEAREHQGSGLVRPVRADVAIGSNAMLFDLKAGANLPRAQAPMIVGRDVLISAKLGTLHGNGVIVAQGGLKAGYALYVRDGKLEMALRDDGKMTVVTAPHELPKGPLLVAATLTKNGTMTLQVAGKTVANGKAPTTLQTMPRDNLQVGRDVGGTVGRYGNQNDFDGVLESVRIELKD